MEVHLRSGAICCVPLLFVNHSLEEFVRDSIDFAPQNRPL